MGVDFVKQGSQSAVDAVLQAAADTTQALRQLQATRDQATLADLKAQAQRDIAYAQATDLQPVTSDVVTKATGYWAVKTNTNK